jgi:hypothetical protein
MITEHVLRHVAHLNNKCDSWKIIVPFYYWNKYIKKISHVESMYPNT